jgi:hypothetical protein
MNKNESPGGNQGGTGRNRSCDSFYPVTPGSVNTSPALCVYQKGPTPKRHNGFCAFTGEGLRGCPCPFMDVSND